MDQLEKVEKIREKTGVSYEDAKSALEACNYDLLDAIVYLEKLGKIKAPEVGSWRRHRLLMSSPARRKHSVSVWMSSSRGLATSSRRVARRTSLLSVRVSVLCGCRSSYSYCF